MAARLSGRHGNLIKEIITNNAMIPEFYQSLAQKIHQKDVRVMDIVKMLHREKCIIVFDIDNQYLSLTDNARQLCDAFLLRCLNNSVTRGINKITCIYDFTDDDIQNMLPNEFSDYDSWIKFGCPKSTDHDIVAFVPKQYQSNGQIKPLSNTALKRLESEMSMLGFDMSKEIDLSLVYVDPDTQTISASSKCGPETQNIILDTWMNHSQLLNENGIPLALALHPMQYYEPTHEDLFIKLRMFAKYLLDYAEDICGNNYAALRPLKKEAYAKNGNHMMRFIADAINYVITDPTIVYKTFSAEKIVLWHSRYKAMVMKLIQIIMQFQQNRAIYTKAELAQNLKILDLHLTLVGKSD